MDLDYSRKITEGDGCHRVTVPPGIMKFLNLQKGDQLQFEMKAEGKYSGKVIIE